MNAAYQYQQTTTTNDQGYISEETRRTQINLRLGPDDDNEAKAYHSEPTADELAEQAYIESALDRINRINRREGLKTLFVTLAVFLLITQIGGKYLSPVLERHFMSSNVEIAEIPLASEEEFSSILGEFQESDPMVYETKDGTRFLYTDLGWMEASLYRLTVKCQVIGTGEILGTETRWAEAGPYELSYNEYDGYEPDSPARTINVEEDSEFVLSYRPIGTPVSHPIDLAPTSDNNEPIEEIISVPRPMDPVPTSKNPAMPAPSSDKEDIRLRDESPDYHEEISRPTDGSPVGRSAEDLGDIGKPVNGAVLQTPGVSFLLR